MRTSRRACAFAAATLAAFVWADPASACAVCYGGESDMTTGMNNGIATLLGVVAFVQVGFAGLFGSIWYRTRKLRKLKEQFHLIEGDR